MNQLSKDSSLSSQDVKWTDTPYATGKDGYASIEIIEQLEKAQRIPLSFIKDYFEGRLSGGPGYSCKSAWIVDMSNEMAVDCEYNTLWLLFHKLNLLIGETDKEVDVEPLRQQLRCIDGHYYDVHILKIHLPGNPVEVEQWFDISKYFNKHRR